MPKKKSEPKILVGTNIPPQLIDYKVSMTIRTGEYSNIVVDFHFEEGTMEDAVMTIDKYVDEMYTKYYNFLERPKTVPVDLLFLQHLQLLHLLQHQKKNYQKVLLRKLNQ